MKKTICMLIAILLFLPVFGMALSAEEEIELAERMAKGDPYARKRLSEANLRLVVSIAKRYGGRGAGYNCEMCGTIVRQLLQIIYKIYMSRKLRGINYAYHGKLRAFVCGCAGGCLDDLFTSTVRRNTRRVTMLIFQTECLRLYLSFIC